MIRLAWDHIDLTANVSGLHNAEHAHALLSAIVDPADLKKSLHVFRRLPYEMS